MRVINRWKECYEGVHTQTPPNEFKQLFCNSCMNTSCELSKGGGLSWSKRMAYQVERMLNDPKFADERDPEFQQIRNLDFKDLLHRELTLKVSSDRGDWSIPTDIEVSVEASKLLNTIDELEHPQGFTPELLPEAVLPQQPVQQDTEYKYFVKGSGDNTYIVTNTKDNWTCTCPSFTYSKLDTPTCKHIDQHKPVKQDTQDTTQEAPVPRPPPINKVPQMNTQQPTTGIMLSGNKEQPEDVDPWAAPSEVSSDKGTLKSGMKFSFKK